MCCFLYTHLFFFLVSFLRYTLITAVIPSPELWRLFCVFFFSSTKQNHEVIYSRLYLLLRAADTMGVMGATLPFSKRCRAGPEPMAVGAALPPAGALAARPRLPAGRAVRGGRELFFQHRPGRGARRAARTALPSAGNPGLASKEREPWCQTFCSQKTCESGEIFLWFVD